MEVKTTRDCCGKINHMMFGGEYSGRCSKYFREVLATFDFNCLFYFSMYRPQKKLRLERKRFLLSLRKGNHVVTSSGIYGVIKVLRDKYVELEIAPKVVIKVEKTAIHHGDVELIDAETAKKAGAAVVGAEAENPEETDRLSKQRKTTDTETIEEVVEVDSAAEEGTEIIEEVIEVDENGNEISREKK